MEQQEREQGATGDAPEAPNNSADETQAGEPDVAELSARVQELEERAQRYMANWQRAQADLQNFRRQVERDQEEMAQWASAALMQQTLSVLDDLERAFGSVPQNLLSLTWVEGIWFVYKKLEAMLVARGLEAMDVQPGQTFDPNLHQAVTEVDGGFGAVVDVVQRGYTVSGRLLRPALVTVGNGNVAAEPPGDGGETEASEEATEGGDANSGNGDADSATESTAS
ncbi:MAG: nucleotide exchange factor GrpE [Chloroflexota bacterium]|nr:nucleotide exchange factor GrpE [Chloroflexota bacterium]